jgi:hypothetical protein
MEDYPMPNENKPQNDQNKQRQGQQQNDPNRERQNQPNNPNERSGSRSDKM